MRKVSVLVCALWLSGCDPGASPTLPNGISLNGIMPNGVLPNGVITSGTRFIGLTVSGKMDPAQRSTWNGTMNTGKKVVIRVSLAKRLAHGWGYELLAELDGHKAQMCAGGAMAVLVPGSWDVDGDMTYYPSTTETTIACRGSSIAKCFELGYSGDKLAACVRALRADYCGDGTPYTVNGTLVNLYDGAGIATDAADWSVEAEWAPGGASCIRSTTATRASLVAHKTPSCLSRLHVDPDCGKRPGADTVVTELKP